jgi:xanthine dehydrogenase accessory factor
VAHLAHWLGFRVAANDDRPEFCTSEAIPDADEFYPCSIAELPSRLVLTPWTYLVLTTRGVDVDVPGLPALLETPTAYLGVIGSRRRWAEARKQLLAAGISEEKLSRVHTPIGLDIHAETPEEIAVSIMAEIIGLKNGE